MPTPIRTKIDTVVVYSCGELVLKYLEMYIKISRFSLDLLFRDSKSKLQDSKTKLLDSKTKLQDSKSKLLNSKSKGFQAKSRNFDIHSFIFGTLQDISIKNVCTNY